MAATRLDDRRVVPTRASRSSAGHRLIAQEVFEATTTTAPPPPTTVARRAVVRREPERRPARVAVKTTATSAPARRQPAAKATAAPKPQPAAPPPSSTGNSQTGKASWYDTYAGTCAHRTLPKGLIVTVTNVANGKQVNCRVADRGPYIAGRVIDLARDAFQALAPTSSGVIDVRLNW